MLTKTLPNETVAKTGFTHLFVLTFADLTQTAANTAQVITLLTLAIGDLVGPVATVLKTTFANSADAAFNTTAVTIGDATTANRFVTSQELNTNGTSVKYKGHAHTTPAVFTASDALKITFNAMAAKILDDLNGGELHVYAGITRLAALDGQYQS